MKKKHKKPSERLGILLIVVSILAGQAISMYIDIKAHHTVTGRSLILLLCLMVYAVISAVVDIILREIETWKS